MGDGGESGDATGGTGGTAGSSGTAGGGGTAGPGGSGGTAGSGGAAGAGAAGTSGAAGTGGTAGGTAGTGGVSGTGGSGETCPGCARLSAPLDTSSGTKAHFVVSLPSGTDFTAAEIHYLVFVQAGAGGLFRSYVQDASGFSYVQVGSTSITAITGWQDLSWTVPVGGSSFDRTQVLTIGIELVGGTGATDPTVIYVDSITVTSPSLSFTFDDANTVLETAQMEHLADQRMWLNTDSEPGSALTWLGP